MADTNRREVGVGLIGFGTIGRGVDGPDGLGDDLARTDVDDAGLDALAGKRAGNEHRPPLVAAHPLAGGGDALDVEREVLAFAGSGHRLQGRRSHE